MDVCAPLDSENLRWWVIYAGGGLLAFFVFLWVVIISAMLVSRMDRCWDRRGIKRKKKEFQISRPLTS